MTEVTIGKMTTYRYLGHLKDLFNFVVFNVSSAKKTFFFQFSRLLNIFYIKLSKIKVVFLDSTTKTIVLFIERTSDIRRFKSLSFCMYVSICFLTGPGEDLWNTNN